MQFRFTAPSCSWRTLLLSLLTLGVPPLAGYAAHPVHSQPVHMSGVVTVVHVDDFAHGRSALEYLLDDTQSHRRAKLQFGGDAPSGVHTGTRVTVTGIPGDDGSILLASDSASLQTMQTAIAPTVVSGVQDTIAIIANFTDASVTLTPSQVQDILFTDPNGYSIDALYRETSFGNVAFSGQVVGPFVINFSSTSACNLASWADAADAAATAAGVNLSSYPRRLYVMPSTEMSVCGADGAGQVGGSPSRAWVFNYTVNDVYAHELGHNLNMAHASTLANQYGDASDDMSADGYPLRNVNAPHMEQMGWMPPANIVTVTQSGTYTVAALEISPAQAPAPQILKIAKPDTGDYYYFSYREPLGLDSGLRTAYWNRVNVHKYTGNYAAYNTYLLQLLDDAGVFSDTTNGISVTQVSHTSDRATVQIQLSTGSGTTTCQPATPVLALAPSSQGGSAGSTLAYTVTLTNKDNAYCAASTFSLADSVPSGWAGSVFPASLSLSPGATGSATLSVTSTTVSAAATYTAQLYVSDAASATHAVSGSVSYLVQAPAQCTRYAPSIVFSPISQSGYAGGSISYTVSISDNDSSSCTASTFSLGDVIPAGWAAALSPTSMSLSPGTTSSATFAVTSVSTAAAATYGVQVNTTDSASTTHGASGNGSYVIQADAQAPSSPSGLAAAVSKRTRVSLTWLAATDNVGVAGYEVWRNGARVATTTATSYAETLTTGAYTYSVVAYDAAGNRSSASNSVSVTVKSR